MNLHTGTRVNRLLPGVLGVSLALSGVAHAPLWGQEMDQATLARLKAATILVKAQGPDVEKSGTGFLLARQNRRGVIVTSARVVRDNTGTLTKLECVMNSGTDDEVVRRAKLSCLDEATDLAFLTLPDDDLPAPLEMAAETDLTESMSVFILGFPLGDVSFSSSPGPKADLAKGTVSGIVRDKLGEIVALPITGKISADSSGGPVVTASGALVGIAVARPNAAQIGFAIPAHTLTRLLNGQLSGVHIRRTSMDAERATFELRPTLKDPVENILRFGVLISPRLPSTLASQTELQDADGPLVEKTEEHWLAVGSRGGELPLTWPLASGNRLFFQFCCERRDGPVSYSAPIELRVGQLELSVARSAPDRSMIGGDDPVTNPFEELEIPLPSAVSRAILGGGGRFLIVHLDQQSQVAVIDLEQRKQVLTVELAADGLLAANMDSLITVTPFDNHFDRWSLSTLRKMNSGTMPMAGKVRAIAVGCASKGPMLVFWNEGGMSHSPGRYSLVDVRSMKAQRIGGPDEKPGQGTPRHRTADENMELRAAANGAAFGVWCTNRSPMGVEVILAGRRPSAIYDHATLGFLSPTADGTGLCTGEGLLSIDLTRKRSTNSCVPSTTRNYFLSLLKRDIQVCLLADGKSVHQLTLTDRYVDQSRSRTGKLSLDQRFHLVPQLNLLAMIPVSRDCIVLTTVPLGGNGFAGAGKSSLSGKPASDADSERDVDAGKTEDE